MAPKAPAPAFVATVASVRRLGIGTLSVWCRRKRSGNYPCSHGSTVPVKPFPDDTPLAAMARRLRCVECGARRQVDPDWRELAPPAPLTNFVGEALPTRNNQGR